MTTSQAWELVKAGKIKWEWRRWVTADKREFPWHDPESRMEALIEAAIYISKK